MVYNSSSITFIAIVIVFISYYGWKLLYWVWFKPKNLERLLRKQGLKGNPYCLYYGDSKEMISMTEEANRCRPLHFSDDILGHVFPFHRHILDKYGNNSFTWRGPIPRVNIMDPDLINEIMMKNEIFKKPKQHPIHSLLTTGIGSYEGEKWAKQRRIMNPAFYMEKLKVLVP
ncbi:cytochrome P450 72A397-like [Impatiens glandulifera]|uniref:cytochrome P450 72A397-like n=1 Tax=Impatiens glandulifera TaxID=253017 RepID=UPI001FB0CC06|nr:cytochrome P450 72A397-like [Impatiens glandulifera]